MPPAWGSMAARLVQRHCQGVAVASVRWVPSTRGRGHIGPSAGVPSAVFRLGRREELLHANDHESCFCGSSPPGLDSSGLLVCLTAWWGLRMAGQTGPLDNNP